MRLDRCGEDGLERGAKVHWRGKRNCFIVMEVEKGIDGI